MTTFQIPVNPTLFAFIDNGNSSLDPLDAGDSFTGSTRNVTYYNKITVVVQSDQIGTLYIHQYFDVNVSPVITTTAVYGGGGIAAVTNQQLSLPYYTVEYVNGGVAQTTFLLSTKVSVFQ